MPYMESPLVENHLNVDLRTFVAFLDLQMFSQNYTSKQSQLAGAKACVD